MRSAEHGSHATGPTLPIHFYWCAECNPHRWQKYDAVSSCTYHPLATIGTSFRYTSIIGWEHTPVWAFFRVLVWEIHTWKLFKHFRYTLGNVKDPRMYTISNDLGTYPNRYTQSCTQHQNNTISVLHIHLHETQHARHSTKEDTFTQREM